MRNRAIVVVLSILVAACKAHPAADGVACWGNGFSGELGPETRGTHVPTSIAGVIGATQLQLGNGMSCARTGPGPLQCWGSLEDLGTFQRPTPVTALADAVEIRTGSRFGCARRAAGTVVCWGTNLVGQLGNGAAPDPHTLVPIAADGTTTADLTAGDSHTPVAVTGLDDATQLAIARSHACALRRGGTVVCWGAVELPGADTSDRPIAVPGVAGATMIAAGEYGSCAIVQGGAVWCWGSLKEGGLPPLTWPAPTKIDKLDGAVEIAMVETEACARTAAGAIACWHADGKVFPRAVDHAVQLAGGFRHLCARTAAGGVTCWGDNLNGQLGAENVDADGLVHVPDLDHVVELAVGGSHTCVISKR